MKKALLAIVAIAVVITIGYYVTAGDEVKVKETKKQIPAGEMTTTKVKAKTPEGKMKVTDKELTKGGEVKGTQMKEVQKTPGETKKVKITQIIDNDPNNNADNWITYVDAKNVTRKARLPKDMKINDLKKFKDKFKMVSTYKIGEEEFVKDFPMETEKLEKGMKTQTPAQ